VRGAFTKANEFYEGWTRRRDRYSDVQKKILWGHRGRGPGEKKGGNREAEKNRKDPEKTN